MTYFPRGSYRREVATVSLTILATRSTARNSSFLIAVSRTVREPSMGTRAASTTARVCGYSAHWTPSSIHLAGEAATLSFLDSRWLGRTMHGHGGGTSIICPVKAVRLVTPKTRTVLSGLGSTHRTTSVTVALGTPGGSLLVAHI